MGLISKQEYLEAREKNFAQISDSEEEEKEVSRLKTKLKESSKFLKILETEDIRSD